MTGWRWACGKANLQNSPLAFVSCGLLTLLLAAGCTTKPGALSIIPAQVHVQSSAANPAGQATAVDVRLRNDGGRPLTILNVHTSCTCTVAEAVKTPRLLPGQETTLKLNVTPPQFGKTQSEVTIVSDIPSTSVIPLQLEGDSEPIPHLRSQSRQLELIGKVPGDAVRGDVAITTVEQRGSTPWIRGLVSTPAGMTAVLRQPVSESPIADDLVRRQYLFDVSSPCPNSGKSQFQLFPDLATPNHRTTLPVPVSIEYVASVRAVPSEIILDDSNSIQDIPLLLISRDDQKFQIVSLTCSDAKTSIEVPTSNGDDAEGTVHNLTLEIDPNQLGIDSVEAHIEIKTNHPDGVPIRIRVRRKH